MATPVTLVLAGAPPYVPVTSGAPVATPVTSGAPPITLVASGAPPIVLQGDAGGAVSGLSWAYDAYHAWDFLTDEVRFANLYKGALANTPGWSFTRASVGYAQDNAGVLIPFASGEMRRTDKGVLIEGARTNLALRSQEFDNASWSKSRATITGNAAVAPDGTLTADKITEDNTAGATHRVYQGFVKAAAETQYTYTVFLKAAERTFAQIKLGDGSETDMARVDVNLSTGALGTPNGTFTGVSATTTTLANGWYRISLTATTDAEAAVTCLVFIASALGTTSYNGDASSGIYVWGAQLEAAAFPSSYIPTTTASATRAADSLSITGVTGLDYPLSLFAEFERAVDTATIEVLMQIDDGDATDRVQAHITTGDIFLAQVDASSATQATVSVSGAISVGTVTRAAARVATNDAVAAKGGTLGTQDTSVTLPARPTAIRFGSNQTPAFQSFGYLRRAALWSRALTDAELQALTL